MAHAVVFAYHNIGVRCLSVLLAHGVEVALVVTHRDDPDETRWFASVAECAERNRLPLIISAEPDDPNVHARIAAIQPDFIFSFYYRLMLAEHLLALARRGALNMHGSLLPRYRGRAPVNWAIIQGERETGASLHYMSARPDAGDLVDQQAVPILPNDTALDVFKKVGVAAELVLNRCLPGLLAGSAPRRPLDLNAGSYYGRRRPADGRIDWRAPAWAIHNLIRAVAPPYPGALTRIDGRPARILLSHWGDEQACHPAEAPCLYTQGKRIFAGCADGTALEVLSLEIEGVAVDSAEFKKRYGSRAVKLCEKY
jgi:methionyl-tRNA formyltransferase